MWEDEIVRFSLTEDQKGHVIGEVRVHLAAVATTRLECVKRALAAESMIAGKRPEHFRLPWILWLTAAQQDLLQRELRMPVRALLLDVDRDLHIGFVEAWTTDFVPFRLGRLLVAPSEPRRPRTDGEKVVLLEAESSVEGVWGTGRHPATQVAERLMEEWLKPGQSLVDVGTGSGVLAIAAVRLGASTVLAVDVDETAARQARRNAELNGVGDQITVRHGELDPDGDGPFDLAVANIITSVIIDMAPELAKVVRPGGILVISGIAKSRVEEAAAPFELLGLRTIQESVQGAWAARALRRLA